MTQTDFPEAEDFAVAVQRAMVGRKWSWLAETVQIDVNTLNYQLVKKPSALKLRTALRVGTVLGLTVWEPEQTAVAS